MRVFGRVNKRNLSRFLGILSLFIFSGVPVQDARADNRLSLLCVETVWCNIAQQIGGQTLETKSLLTAPGLDPHHFQPSPSLWRSVGQVDGFLINGATYDDWALSFHQQKTGFLNVAEIGHWKNGEDPHLFFDPDIVRSVAIHLADWLSAKAPRNQKYYQDNLASFEHSLDELEQKLVVFKQRYQGLPVVMTEPAGERLLSRTGLDLIDQHWALSVMKQTGVSARETADLEQAFKKGQVRVLMINPLVQSSQITTFMELAARHHIPLVEIQESLPVGLKWQDWMTRILKQLSLALDQRERHR